MFQMLFPRSIRLGLVALAKETGRRLCRREDVLSFLTGTDTERRLAMPKPDNTPHWVYTIDRRDKRYRNPRRSGVTHDLEQRISQHRRTWPRLVVRYTKQYPTKAAALEAERRLNARRARGL